MRGSSNVALGALISAGFAEIALTTAAIDAHGTSDNLFLAIVTLQSGLALGVFVALRRFGTRSAAIVVIAVAVAIRAILLLTPPLLSDDVYRYIWDGRVLNAGFNPYLHVPADPTLIPLRDDAIYPHVDKKEYAVTIYPPVAQVIFAVVTRIADGLLAMKLAMLCFEAVAVWAMLRLLHRLEKSWRWIILYLWHPFAPWEIANNAHVDAAMISMAIAGIAAASYLRPYGLVAAFTASALTKPFAALFLPSAWRPFDLRLPLFVLSLAALLYAPFALSAGAGVFGFLGQYLQEQGLSSGSGLFFVQLAYRVGAPSWIKDVYLVVAGALLLGLAIGLALRSRRDLVDRLGEAAVLQLTFLFLLTPVYPWYALLVAPFATLLGSWCAFAMMTTGFWLYSFQADQIEFSHRWGASIAVVAVAGAVDLWRLRDAGRAQDVA